jgi:hypothetical protein
MSSNFTISVNSIRSFFLEKENDMAKKYTKVEIEALLLIYQNHGNIFYINGFDIEAEFYALTGIVRKSGPLYMAYWRYTKGQYDHLLAS